MKMKKFKWTVEFTVDRSWVEDGFNLTGERAHDMIANALSYAFNHEIGARVIKAPTDNQIARAQGYKSAADCKRRGHTL